MPDVIDRFVAGIIAREPWTGLADIEPGTMAYARSVAVDGENTATLLDTAAVAREVALLTAVVLMSVDGDFAEAVSILDELSAQHPPEEDGELDAASIAAQAIREAAAARSR